MRFHKFISAILHPLVMPVIGVLLYFIFTNTQINLTQELTLLAFIFVFTYIIPMFLLVFLKSINKIKSFQLKTISERKLPVFLIIVLFYSLANVLFKIPFTREISYIFYGTVVSLITVYIFFFFKKKVSLHLIGMGNSVGFFFVFNSAYTIPIYPLIIILIVLSGFLASARLHLKAHTQSEVYLGFCIGLFSQIIAFYLL